MATVKTKKLRRSSTPSRRVRAAQKQSAVPPRPKKRSTPKAKAVVEVAQPVQASRWRRTPKAERPVRRKLPSVVRLTRLAYDLLARDWRLIIGITAVYGLLNVVLVRGLNGGVDIAELKTEFSQLQNGVVGSLGVMASLITSSNTSASDAARAYQSFLIVTTSLALVWCFRQLLLDSAKKLRIRDGFYKGMYPLIPVMVVLLHVGLRLIPMAFGGFLFILVVSTGIAVGTAELYFWSFLFFLTVLWSLLLLIPALFALYIASLPGMTPLRALRSAKKLVRFRRLTVLRKVLFLPVLILIPLSVVLLGAIAIVPVLAQWIYFVLSMLMLPIIHAYMYSLYRELLDE